MNPLLTPTAKTKVLRIDLAQSQDIEVDIVSLCEAQNANGFVLGGCFVYGDQLILIFQKP